MRCSRFFWSAVVSTLVLVSQHSIAKCSNTECWKIPSFGKTCVHKKNLIIVKEKLLAIFSSSLSHFSSKALLECIFLSILRDRFITVVNVMGDAMGTGIVQHLSRDELDEIDEKNNNPTGKFWRRGLLKVTVLILMWRHLAFKWHTSYTWFQQQFYLDYYQLATETITLVKHFITR